LGPEILNEPAVVNSKLSVDQKNLLERDLEIDELDKALEKMNKKSAGGPDGVGDRYIKSFGICCGLH
jgi:hypothetical protein